MIHSDVYSLCIISILILPLSIADIYDTGVKVKDAAVPTSCAESIPFISDMLICGLTMPGIF